MNRMKNRLLKRQWLISGTALIIKTTSCPQTEKESCACIDWCWCIYIFIPLLALYRKRPGHRREMPEPLFWLHFFRARPTTFSVASKRTREHAKGHAMLCLYDALWRVRWQKLDLVREWVAASAFCSVRAIIIYTLHHGDNIYLFYRSRERKREMGYAGCSCWRTHWKKRQQLRANCSFAPSFHLTDDAECRIAHPVAKDRLMLSPSKKLLIWIINGAAVKFLFRLHAVGINLHASWHIHKKSGIKLISNSPKVSLWNFIVSSFLMKVSIDHFCHLIPLRCMPTLHQQTLAKKLISIVSFTRRFFDMKISLQSAAVTSCRALCATFLCRRVMKQTHHERRAPFYAPRSGCDPCALLTARVMKEQASERAAEKVKQNTFSEVSLSLAWHPRRSQRERDDVQPPSHTTKATDALGEKIPHNSPWNFHTRAFKKCNRRIDDRKLYFLSLSKLIPCIWCKCIKIRLGGLKI